MTACAVVDVAQSTREGSAAEILIAVVAAVAVAVVQKNSLEKRWEARD